VVTRDYGPEIDTHDTIIRANTAPAGGTHAKLVGTKTTMRVGNSEATLNMLLEDATATQNNSGVLWFPIWYKGWPADLCEHLTAEAVATLPEGKEKEMRNNVLKMCDNRRTVCDVVKDKLPGTPCLDVSDRFASLLHDIIRSKSGEVISETSQIAFPSSGFFAVWAFLQVCEEVNLYGFEMCTDGKDPHISEYKLQHVQGRDMDVEGKRNLAREQSIDKFFCKYFKEGKALSHLHRDSSPREHLFAVEHAIYFDLERCGLLRIWR